MSAPDISHKCPLDPQGGAAVVRPAHAKGGGRITVWDILTLQTLTTFSPTAGSC